MFSRLSGPPRLQKYHSAADFYNPEEYDMPDQYHSDFPKPKVSTAACVILNDYHTLIAFVESSLVIDLYCLLNL